MTNRNVDYTKTPVFTFDWLDFIHFTNDKNQHEYKMMLTDKRRVHDKSEDEL